MAIKWLSEETGKEEMTVKWTEKGLYFSKAFVEQLPESKRILIGFDDEAKELIFQTTKKDKEGRKVARPSLPFRTSKKFESFMNGLKKEGLKESVYNIVKDEAKSKKEVLVYRASMEGKENSLLVNKERKLSSKEDISK